MARPRGASLAVRARMAFLALALSLLTTAAKAQDLPGPCVPSPVPPPGILVDCLDPNGPSIAERVALITALGEATGPARDEAREALMTAALVDAGPVHRAMRRALVRVGALTVRQARGLPTLTQALRALRRAVGRERADIGVCRLELAGVERGGALRLSSQTLYCADGSVLVGEFSYDPRARHIRVAWAEVEYLH